MSLCYGCFRHSVNFSFCYFCCGVCSLLTGLLVVLAHHAFLSLAVPPITDIDVPINRVQPRHYHSPLTVVAVLSSSSCCYLSCNLCFRELTQGIAGSVFFNFKFLSSLKLVYAAIHTTSLKPQISLSLADLLTPLYSWLIVQRKILIHCFLHMVLRLLSM